MLEIEYPELGLSTLIKASAVYPDASENAFTVPEKTAVSVATVVSTKVLASIHLLPPGPAPPLFRQYELPGLLAYVL